MTAEFLAYSKYVGNDLSTPRPEFGFPGLKPGDRWCLCAGRFLQAAEEGAAPKVNLRRARTAARCEIVPLEVLMEHAADVLGAEPRLAASARSCVHQVLDEEAQELRPPGDAAPCGRSRSSAP